MEAELSDRSRTVVVSGVPDVLPARRMSDKLAIHFQSRRRSRGGDVEVVAYPTHAKGVAFVTFDHAEDAERVVAKEKHIMTDGEFPETYPLTVFPFTRDVFFYVSRAQLDLSSFATDQASLVESLRGAHRSIRFQLSSHVREVTIEGPFAAIRALKEGLVHRAGQLKDTIPTVTITPGESPLNPRVISHHEFASSVSCTDSEAKLGPAGLNGLSALLQSSGEATYVQSLLSNSGRQNSARQQDTDEEEEPEAGSRLKLSSEYDESKARQTFRPERNPGIRSTSPGLYLHQTEKVSADPPAVGDISQRHTRTNMNPPTRQSRNTTHLDPHHSSTDNSAVTSSILSTESRAGNEERLSAGCPRDPEDTCIWVDSNIFRYIEKLDQQECDRCLGGLNASVRKHEGSDLVQICLPEEQPPEVSLTIQQAVKKLETLVDHWQSILRVHEICFEKGEHRKHKLIQICKDANIADVYNDVLYVVEDSRIIIIGPSVSSFLFHKRVNGTLNTIRPQKPL